MNDGGGLLTATPEASYDGVLVEAGPVAPVAFTVAAGYCYGDPYGIDEMRPFGRLWVSGNSSGRWAIQAIRRP